MAKASNLEDTFNKLEAVLNEMEQGELTLDESFKNIKKVWNYSINVILCLIRLKNRLL
ncbi:MAG: exodeoxyribonuclease VII small subunit [Lachnospira pectinoschiza]